MGVWKHTGSPKICFTLSDESSSISTCTTNNTGERSKVYTLTQLYYRKTSSEVFHKIASTVCGK